MMTMDSYIIASSIKEALELAAVGAIVVAGATDLSIRLREMRLTGRTKNGHMVDIARIPELKTVDMDSEVPFIGAAVTIAQLKSDSNVTRRLPMLSQMAATFGSAQVRSAATIGGNVANGSPAADGLTTLTALAAKAEIASMSGRRSSSMEDLVTGPNRTSLHPGEIITGFHFDDLPTRSKSFFYKIGRRKALVIARVNVAICLDMDMADPRVVVGACFPSPRRLTDVEDLLKRGEPGHGLWFEAGKMGAGTFCEVCGWRSSTSYKIPAVTNVIAGALDTLWREIGEA